MVTMHDVEVARFATFLASFRRRASMLVVTFKNGRTYEFDDVPEAVWLELVATARRAEAWKESERSHAEKPAYASLGTFYHARLEDEFPRWRVVAGACTLPNMLARLW